MAAASPAGPPPMMNTSVCWLGSTTRPPSLTGIPSLPARQCVELLHEATTVFGKRLSARVGSLILYGANRPSCRQSSPVDRIRQRSRLGSHMRQKMHKCLFGMLRGAKPFAKYGVVLQLVSFSLVFATGRGSPASKMPQLRGEWCRWARSGNRNKFRLPELRWF